jgi:hypothetical protein
MHTDPLMPAFRRFPRDLASRAGSDAAPSAVRPFVLRAAQVGGVPVAKHRTPSTQRKIPQPTTSDGKNPTTKTDYYTTPDD